MEIEESDCDDDDDSSNDGSIDDDSFIDDDKVIKHDPFPDECQNEIIGIESFYMCLTSRYNICPRFFPGSLQDACQTAFKSIILEERRPVLVYIHYDQSMFSNIFCSTIFCSEIIQDYLNNNYIVWPWDITFESNKNTLAEIWNNLFSIQPENVFTMEKCPMLIGIMRQSVGEKNWISASEYEFKILLECDTIIRTYEKSTLEIFLRELIIFKEKFDEIEQISSFDFVSKTGLCWEVIMEISKYLTLNDIMKTFSDDILPFICKYQRIFHLSNPSNTFINTILQKIKSEQIISLRLNATLYWSSLEISSFINLTNIISLNLLDFHSVDLINISQNYFPKLLRLSLIYTDEFNLHILKDILKYLQKPIKRLEIHCNRGLNNYFHLYRYDLQFQTNSTIEYFLIDIGHFPLPSVDEYLQSITFINLIKKMSNIRHVHFVMNSYNLKELLIENEWRDLIISCHQLNKIIIEILDHIPEKLQLINQAKTFEKILRNDRLTIKFQFVFR